MRGEEDGRCVQKESRGKGAEGRRCVAVFCERKKERLCIFYFLFLLNKILNPNF
jgi:hypothetical protein